MHTLKNQALPLKTRRYTLLDAAVICFRCSPIATFFYGFLDLAAAAIIPLRTLVVAGFIDASIAAVRDGDDLNRVYLNLILIVSIAAYQWSKQALHNFADLRLVLSLREKYRTALTEKRTRLAYRHIENADTWDLIERLTTNPEGGRLKEAYFHLIDMTSFVLKVGGLLAILTTAVWWGGLTVVAVSALTLITGVRGGKRQYQSERQIAKHDRRTSYLARILLGREAAAERTLFNFTASVGTMWRESHNTGMGIRIRARLRWYLSAYAGSLIGIGSWIFMMVILLRPLQVGAISIGLFISLTQAFTNLDIVWGFMQTVHGLAADGEFFKDLTTFLALDEASAISVEDRAEPPLLEPEFTSLELHGVRFRYPGTENWILDCLSYRFEPGRHYALVGANGAGKTTLTRLLTGLYPVDAGGILLNGRPIDSYPHQELLSYFSLVYQDFARYNVSLRDNILLGSGFGARGDDESHWRELMSDVGLSDVVAQLPLGLDTPLGKLQSTGVDLSGGEWQRVAMARALAAPAPIRILDEPTASLDPVAESRLYELFDRMTSGLTTLFISHRLGATKIADTIIVLADGKVAESGSHEELMDSGGLYRRMFDSQRSWYE
jgi:ATP-binding cassette, subfamily B, bacterial